MFDSSPIESWEGAGAYFNSAGSWGVTEHDRLHMGRHRVRKVDQHASLRHPIVKRIRRGAVGAGVDEIARAEAILKEGVDSVSYTHLTLPTNREV